MCSAKVCEKDSGGAGVVCVCVCVCQVRGDGTWLRKAIGDHRQVHRTTQKDGPLQEKQKTSEQHRDRRQVFWSCPSPCTITPINTP